MRLRGKLKIVIPIMLFMLILTACKVGEERYELSNYVGSSVKSFERKSGAKLEKQSNGVYVKENVVQVMAPNKNVTSVTLLKNAGNYKLFGINIGMKKSEAEPLLKDAFGNQIAKTINSDKNWTTYSYLKNEQELYISYNIDKESVEEVSYYKLEAPKNQEAESVQEEETNSGELIAMIGESRIYYNEAMVYLKSAQDNYEADYGKNIWKADILGNGQTFGDMIKDEVMRQITELKIIRDKAAEQEITLTEEELADAHSYAKEHYNGLTDKGKNQYLITQELLDRVYEDNLLANKVFETLTINVDTNVADAEAKQITVQDIFIKGARFDLAGNRTEYTAEEKEDAYNKAKSLLEQAKLTDDFKTLAETSSEADTIEYTFGKGQGPKEYGSIFEQAAFTLRTGQVSDLITTNDGWHIIYCVTDFNVDATTQVKENIIEQRRNEMFSKLYSDWSADYDIVINSQAWKAISYED
jgi:parvulin-like peptidyl-prolyl isomerase